MRNILSLGILLAVLSSGCASIVSKSRYPVLISSAPDGASFSITDRDGKQVATGVAPNTVVLKSGNGFFRKAIYSVKFSKEGYQDKMFTISSQVNGWYFGNLIFGGLIGFLIVDPATGAMYRIGEHEVQGVLNQPTSSIKDDYKPSLKIMSIEEIPVDRRDSLIRIN